MAVVTTFSHQFLEEVVKGEHDLTTDTLKVILMETTFAFDPDTHKVYDSGETGDVSTSEIDSGNGYTTAGETLTSVDVSIDTGADQVDITADNVTWTATGGAIAETGSAVIYNSSHASNTVVMCIDFGADYITAEDKLFQLNFSNGMAVVDNG
jgi:hypothetical protein